MSKNRRNKKKLIDAIEYKNVTELNLSIKQTLEEPYENIKVLGEITNFKISNKNLFATLKDNESTINIVSWGYSYKKQNVTNGDTVLAYGKIVHYSKSGNYCLVVNKFEKLGIGNLHQEYEQLKQKYDQLGYFTNKKDFPQQLNKIGIVTALEGAALQDILYVLKKNNYNGKIVIKGCMVQGIKAPQSIAESINALTIWKDNDNKVLDLIIIARGGGSFEDLIAFSSPEVIEAIHNCNIFTISAVGHEIDFMLSDFVSDMRAPTPSISAEIVSTYQNTELNNFNKCKSFIETQINQMLHSNLLSYKTKISLLSKSLENPEAKISNYEVQLNTIKNKISNIIKSNMLQTRNKLENLSAELQKYDIKNMLEQGYVILIKNNRIIDSVNDVKPGQKLKLKMRDGDVNIIIAE